MFLLKEGVRLNPVAVGYSVPALLAVLTITEEKRCVNQMSHDTGINRFGI